MKGVCLGKQGIFGHVTIVLTGWVYLNRMQTLQQIKQVTGYVFFPTKRGKCIPFSL